MWNPIFRRAMERGELRADLDLTEIAEWLALIQFILVGRLDFARPDDPGHRRLLKTFVLPALLPAVALAVRDALDGTLVEMGSAGAKVASVVQGLSDVYVHAGGQYEWDSAAPVAVARAAGLHTSRIDGSPLVYNRRDPKLPDLVVCRPELAEAVLEVTRA